MRKTVGWHRACQTKEQYFQAWESGVGPGQEVSLAFEKKRESFKQRVDAITRQLWEELHSEKNPTQEWFAAWLERVPNYGGCKCRVSFESIIKDNPPRFNDWFAWTVEVHNAVNRKLNRKEWTVEEAKARWVADFTE